jgi:RNA polymerase sigma factor (sigma-70 family)
MYKSTTVFDDDRVVQALGSASTVTENLNGGQIQTLLNGFLYRCIEVIVINTSLMDEFVAYILYYVTYIRKKKLTYSTREEVVDRLTTYLLTTDTHLKFRLLRSVNIERYYLYRFIRYCVAQLNICQQQQLKVWDSSPTDAKECKKNLTEFLATCTRLGVSPNKTCVVYGQVQSLFNCYAAYRQNVISHYYKLCHKKARKYFKDKANAGYDLDEVYQDYLVAVAKAIDKYDSRRGAVTSYINWWILNVSTCDYSTHEYGIAYTIPASYRRELAKNRALATSNFAISLETPIGSSGDEDATLKDKLASEGSDHAVNMEEAEDMVRFRRLVKAVDPTGLARIALGVEETFSAEERQQMRDHSAACIAQLYGVTLNGQRSTERHN